jgi:hypothetical protein
MHLHGRMLYRLYTDSNYFFMDYNSPFALSLFNILNFKLLVKIRPQSQPLQDGFLSP